MQYHYGAVIRVVAPGGRTLTGQMGEETSDGDVVIHIQSHGIEAPASVLRDEGWQVPDLDRVTPEPEQPGQDQMIPQEPVFAHEAAQIVDALLNDEERNALATTRQRPMMRNPGMRRPEMRSSRGPAMQRPPGRAFNQQKRPLR